ncbi:MAG: DUF5320 domain-containing protein [Thaumarchaeota archaeon]|nr:DUF5320 domain-containing protein [Candidatus Terraquivivens yellowstonensis]MCL7387985.1 DUF5320 domain-containing protein [Candidatus Terraquivivens yellowstonensis]MCL7392493.1 DUF5320 domain-containing protein [Candidatus Terraquivivens yellowstonensis]MCL7394654.1 DUF5320 domain-containing protein [Candidatus Terraquivivens yellowstonensis]MCL7398222.1 DUF5320 domain-containing protein [Candidatus Terraquivivens yellowstonensis]
MRGGWFYQYWYRGWWCPRHPWPPAWARAYSPWYGYPVDPSDELRYLEEVKKELERQVSEISKKIEELRKSLEEKR